MKHIFCIWISKSVQQFFKIKKSVDWIDCFKVMKKHLFVVILQLFFNVNHTHLLTSVLRNSKVRGNEPFVFFSTESLKLTFNSLFFSHSLSSLGLVVSFTSLLLTIRFLLFYIFFFSFFVALEFCWSEKFIKNNNFLLSHRTIPTGTEMGWIQQGNKFSCTIVTSQRHGNF